MASSVKKNYIFNLAYQILNILVPIVTMPYVSRALGAAGVGEYSYTYSIVSYFLIFCNLGTALYGCREIARNSSSKHRKSLVFFEILLIRVISSAIVISFYFFFILSWGFNEIEIVLFAISSLYLFAAALDTSWLFQGEEKFFFIMLFSLFAKVISVFAIFLLVKSEKDVGLYVLIHALIALLTSLAFFVKIPGTIERVSLKEVNIIKHLVPVLVLFIPQISKEIYCALDKTMIGVIYSDRSLNGYYEYAVSIVSMSMTIITSLNIVKMSNFSHSGMAQNKTENIRRMMMNSFRFVWFLGFPICCGLAMIIDVFVPFFFGSGYDPIVGIVYILIPKILIIGVSNAIGVQYLIASGKHREFNFSIVVGLVVNVILNLILIPLFSVYGAAIATILSEGAVMIAQLVFVGKTLNFRTIFPKETVKNLLSSLGMVVILFPLKMILVLSGVSGLVSLLFLISIGVVSYISCEILLKDTTALNFVMTVKNALRRVAK